jgi:hypothetical protein
MMSIATLSKTTGANPGILLNQISKELQLYQQECKLYQQLLRSMDPTLPQVETLRGHLKQNCNTTLPKLQQALRSLEGQNANVTSAESGQSHVSYFMEQLQRVRAQIMALKYEVFELLHQNPVKPRIW